MRPRRAMDVTNRAGLAAFRSGSITTLSASRQGKHEQRVAGARRVELRRQAAEDGGPLRDAPRSNREVLTPSDAVSHGTSRHRAVQDGLPQQRTGFSVERSEAPNEIAGKDQSAAGREQRSVDRRTLLVRP